MEIFNINNQAARVQRQARDEQEKRAQRAKDAARPGAFSRYVDEAELDAEVREVEHGEAVRPLEGNDQEAAREDRQQSGHFDHAPGEQGSHLDLEG
jgi:hypothetical protein